MDGSAGVADRVVGAVDPVAPGEAPAPRRSRRARTRWIRRPCSRHRRTRHGRAGHGRAGHATNGSGRARHARARRGHTRRAARRRRTLGASVWHEWCRAIQGPERLPAPTRKGLTSPRLQSGARRHAWHCARRPKGARPASERPRGRYPAAETGGFADRFRRSRSARRRPMESQRASETYGLHVFGGSGRAARRRALVPERTRLRARTCGRWPTTSAASPTSSGDASPTWDGPGCSCPRSTAGSASASSTWSS